MLLIILLTPQHLKFKVNSIIMLILNLKIAQALASGTRMRMKALHRKTSDCEVLIGSGQEKT